MADAVVVKTLFNGQRRIAVQLTNRSDGTGEADVIKVDKSTLINSLGAEPGALNLEEVWWTIQGFASVMLEWDHTTDDKMIDLAPGQGYENFEYMGTAKDPASAGGTGDVILTTFGALAGATYSILLVLRKT